MQSLDKKAFYESATAKLLTQINTFALPETDKKKAVHFTTLFREAFKYDEIKQYVFMTHDKKLWDLGYDSAGFCRIASIVFAIVMGINDWKLMYIDENSWDVKMDHHYLKHIPSGKFFDITYDQFIIDGYYKEIPYNLGYTAAFGLQPNDMSIRFAKVLGIDMFKLLKNTTNGK